MTGSSLTCPGCGASLIPGARCYACMLDLGLEENDDQKAPQAFGDFEIEEEIARGGMGVVYRARQISLNREVALKCIHRSRLASESLMERFQVEAEASANLDHPNIVPVYDTGTHEDVPYLCMKLIEGGDLASFLGGRDSPPHDVRTAVDWMAKVARAVHHAHGRGILHRDLKPNNILIDKEGEPYVTDFGLAKFLDTDADLTRTATIMGTPHYMSPEQCQDNQAAVSVTSDVFSLCIILHHLLTGKVPFDGDTSLEVMRQIANHAPVKPLKIGEHAIDRDLDTICRKGLEKTPESRYASALALAEDLERWLAGEPIRARPTGMIERGVKWARRNPALASLAGVAASALLLGSAAAIWQGVRAAGEANRANTTARQLAEHLYAADMKIAQEAIADGRLAYARRLLESHPLEFRGWTWHWLWQNARSEKLDTLTGHTKPVNDVAISADGHLLASGGKDATLRLWDPHARIELSRFTAEKEDVSFSDLSFIEDDAQLVATSSLLLNINPIEQEFQDYHFRLNNRELALVKISEPRRSRDRFPNTVIDDDGAIRSNEHQAKFPSMKSLPDIGIFASESTVITANHEFALTIWNARKGFLYEHESLSGHEGAITSIAAAHSNHWFATSSEDRTIGLWSLMGEPSHYEIIPSMRAYPIPAHFSPDGKFVAGSAGDTEDPYRLTIWDLDRHREAHRVWGLPLKFVSAGKVFVTIEYETDVSEGGYASVKGGIEGYQAKALIWWDLTKDPAERQHVVPLVPATSDQMMTAQLSPDETELLVGGKGGEVFRYDVRTGKRLGILFKVKRYVIGLTYSPNGEYLGFAGERCGLFHLATRKIQFGPDSQRPLVTKPVISPNGQWFAYSPFDGSIQVKDLTKKDSWQTIIGNKASVKYLSFSADSRTLAGGDTSGKVRLWDMATFREIANFPLDRFCSFSPDGRTLIGGTSQVSVMRLRK